MCTTSEAKPTKLISQGCCFSFALSPFIGVASNTKAAVAVTKLHS